MNKSALMNQSHCHRYPIFASVPIFSISELIQFISDQCIAIYFDSISQKYLFYVDLKYNLLVEIFDKY